MTARSTAEVRKLDPTAIVCFRQADRGEYLREASLALEALMSGLLTSSRRIPSLRPKQLHLRVIHGVRYRYLVAVAGVWRIV